MTQEMDETQERRPEKLSRRDFIKLAGVAGAASVLTACSKIGGATPVGAKIPETATTTPTAKPNPTETPTSTAEPSPTATATETPAPTATPTPEVYNWDYVSQKTDEEIFSAVGIPNPEDFSLTEEILPYKVLRNKDGQSYALFQNSQSLVVLAQNLETRIIEHAVYVEHPGGVPLMILTDESVVDYDGGWFKLNPDYGPDAEKKLGEAFNRALAMKYWHNEHIFDFAALKGRDNMPSLNEIPGYNSKMATSFLTRAQRKEINSYMLNKFLTLVDEARKNNNPLNLVLADKRRSNFDAANETLIIKAVRNTDITWKQIYDNIKPMKFYPWVDAQKNGLFLHLYLQQPSFLPSRDPKRVVGGTFTHFFRYFFGGRYFFNITTAVYSPSETDMTSTICDVLCQPGSLPSVIRNYYKNIYPTDDWGHLAPPTNNCAVVFGK